MAVFLVNREAEPRDASALPPWTTVLDYLRGCGLVGTKEGCATGDCGACTAVVAEPDGAGSLRYTARNTCITMLPMLHGRQLITVEGLAQPGGKLHPVQQAMVDEHGSQCGFCTPGFVMSLFAHLKANGSSSREAIVSRLAGNLCRCTGYRPIIDAGMSLKARHARDDYAAGASQTARKLAAVSRRPSAMRGLHAPRSIPELAAVLAKHPKARIVAGATDYALALTQDLEQPPEVVLVGGLAALQRMRANASSWEIGAGASYEDCSRALGPHLPGFGRLMERFGSPQIRAWATVGGNIGNASPIADGPPVFLVLDGKLILQRGRALRTISLADFYLGYRKTTLAPGEFIRALRIAKPAPDDLFAVHKVSKRIDDDISSVCGAFRLKLEGGIVRKAWIAYGGMAAIPKRASRAEAELVGKPFAQPAVAAAAAALTADFAPISDARASAQYRRTVAANLLWRVYLGQQGQRTELAA